MSLKVGVLALQGAFIEHIAMLAALDVEAVDVRLPSQLESLDGLVIPGGESTTISRLMSEYGLFRPLQEMARSGFPMMGTCAGLIMLARLPRGSHPPTLHAMDVVVRRNAYGRQVDSFETDLQIPTLGSDPFHGVFIRAPSIEEVGAAATALCQLSNGGGVVAARQGRLLGCTFHPELTRDSRLHRYFLDIVAGTA
ncbi:MAG: pyridoxal 5'-phosphate synthase glutaminase subunit PdxT [Chloroflexota bacterium]